jgi:tubulin epsilon
MLCHLTSSCRFNGEMNVDMNEICTNLVPFPRLHFLMTAMSPRRAMNNVDKTKGSNIKALPKGVVQRSFTDLLTVTGQLSSPTFQQKDSTSVNLASAFFGRGNIPLSEFLDGVTYAQTTMAFPDWNPDACKIGLCGTPAPGETASVLGVYNNTGFRSVLQRECGRFHQLYRRKAMLHHYTEFVEEDFVAQSETSVAGVIKEYEAIERNQIPTSIKQMISSSGIQDSILPAF